jgi:hypothetical protein
LTSADVAGSAGGGKSRATSKSDMVRGSYTAVQGNKAVCVCVCCRTREERRQYRATVLYVLPIASQPDSQTAKRSDSQTVMLPQDQIHYGTHAEGKPLTSEASARSSGYSESKYLLGLPGEGLGDVPRTGQKVWLCVHT